MVRSEQQQKAIEVYCRELANKFNESGLDKQVVLSHKPIPVNWDQASVKEDLFKQVMVAIIRDKDGTPKTSTADLDGTEVNTVYETLNRWTGQEFGISMEFPHEEEK